MAVTDRGVVDALSNEKESGRLALRIFDHLPWSDDILETHLVALQGKLNDYMDYIVAGQYRETYDVQDVAIVVKVVFKYSPNEEGLRCLNIAKEVIENAGYYLEWEVSSGK